MSVTTVQLRKALYMLQQGVAGRPNLEQKDCTSCSSKGPHEESQEHGLHCEREDLYRPAPWAAEAAAAVGAIGSGFAAVMAGPGRALGLKMAAAGMEGENCDRKAFALRKFEGLDSSLDDFANDIDCELVKWLPAASDGAAVDSSLAHAWLGEPEGCQHSAEEDDGGDDRMVLGLWSPQSSRASPASRAQEELPSSDTDPGVGSKHVGQTKQPDRDVDGASSMASRMPGIHSSDAGLGVRPKHPGKAGQPDEDVDVASRLALRMRELHSTDAGLEAGPKLPGKTEQQDEDVDADGRLAHRMRELHSADAGLGVDAKHPEKPKHPAEDAVSAGRSARGERKLQSADVSLGACPEPTAKALQRGEELHPRPPVLPRPAGVRRPLGSRGRPGRSLPPASCPPCRSLSAAPCRPQPGKASRAPGPPAQLALACSNEC